MKKENTIQLKHVFRGQHLLAVAVYLLLLAPYRAHGH